MLPLVTPPAIPCKQLRIIQVLGPAWIQDLGRPSALSLGIPEGGALVPEALIRANARLGNFIGAPAIEFFGQLEVETQETLWVATPERRWRLKGRLKLSVSERLSYLAVAGGIDVPSVLGGYGTLPASGLGGWKGRALQVGDQLPTGIKPRRHSYIFQAPVPSGMVRFVPGPDPLPQSTLQAFIDRSWSIGPADRIGYCLEGLPLPAPLAAGPSAPMVCGAIQLPPGGLPVVLGPDHPVTGGYPLLGVLAHVDRGSFFGRPLGAKVRFIATDVQTARDFLRG